MSLFKSCLLFLPLPDVTSKQTLADQAEEHGTVYSCSDLTSLLILYSLMAFQLEEGQDGGRLCCRKGEQAWAPRCRYCLLLYWPHVWQVEGSSCLSFCLCSSVGLGMDPAGKPPGQLLGYLQYWVRYTATHCLVRRGAPILIFLGESLRTKLLLQRVLKFSTFSC